RLDASAGAGAAAVRGGGGVLSGLLPGAGLGLAAGAFIVATRLARGLVEERMELERDENGRPERRDGRENEEQVEDGPPESGQEAIPEDIRRMSNEELARSIEDLKMGLGARNAPGPETTQSTRKEGTSSEGDAPSSLLHKLGFRPNPS
ncbi:hypothetical protein THAOC_17331, partial [Thalassiosira oceanica]